MAGKRGPYRKRIKNAGGTNASVGATNDGGGNVIADAPKAESVGDIDAVNPATLEAGFTDPVAGPQTTESNTEPTTGETIGEAPRRPRGRPPNSARINISGVETCLLGIHQTLAIAFGIPEIRMNSEEAEQIAKSYADVATHYPVMQLPEKQLALINFGSTIAIVYGAKLTAYKIRMAMSRPNVVTPIRPQPMKTSGPNATTAPPANEFTMPVPQEGVANGVDLTQRETAPIDPKLRTGEIPGVGSVVFPEDHPLVGKKH